MNKIILRFQVTLIYVIVFLLTISDAKAQDTVLNKYGLWVITNAALLEKTVRHNPGKAMVNLKIIIPTLTFDLRYASINNFMKQKLYPPIKTTYLRSAAAEKLAAVQMELDKSGYGIKIFDAYRPYSVTEKLWEPVKDDRYAADPRKGSGHNRGIAVDLTIINLKDKSELDMGTGFDNFSDTAHHGFKNLPEKILQNRIWLKTMMEKYGFVAIDTEWWHYYLPNAKDFELMDIPFKKLASLKN